jgi:hypothetical protein
LAGKQQLQTPIAAEKWSYLFCSFETEIQADCYLLLFFFFAFVFLMPRLNLEDLSFRQDFCTVFVSGSSMFDGSFYQLSRRWGSCCSVVMRDAVVVVVVVVVVVLPLRYLPEPQAGGHRSCCCSAVAYKARRSRVRRARRSSLLFLSPLLWASGYLRRKVVETATAMVLVRATLAAVPAVMLVALAVVVVVLGG